MSQGFKQEYHAPVPLWRDVRILRWLFQFVVLLLVMAVLAFLLGNLQENLRRFGLSLSFSFLDRRAGFQISEGPAFDSNSPIRQAFMVGLANTLRVAAAGIVLATLLGTMVGIARLSRNWLVNRLALAYIEIMQNTPLLVQLFFWFVLVRALPRQRRGEMISIPPQPIDIGPLHIPQFAFFSQRGGAVPGLEVQSYTVPILRIPLPDFDVVIRAELILIFLIAALVGAFVVWQMVKSIYLRRGTPPTGQVLWAVAAFVVVLGLGLLLPGQSVSLDIPELSGEGIIIRYEGGWQMSSNFMTLLLGLVLYTGAFIAEVVRAGIQAVSYGQIEAATSLGLARGQQLRLIILPQAMRVVIPPLINQYLNLTKNSSLAIAVAYPDLFNVSQTIGNQTGQSIQVIAIVMSIYLVLSLVISLVMNFLNKRLQIVER
jgi:general L-amino acid transport system permease protein